MAGLIKLVILLSFAFVFRYTNCEHNVGVEKHESDLNWSSLGPCVANRDRGTACVG
jgi:hypothetical protein